MVEYHNNFREDKIRYLFKSLGSIKDRIGGGGGGGMGEWGIGRRWNNYPLQYYNSKSGGYSVQLYIAV